MKTLYEQTVEVVAAYLGPAAKRFVDRQINFHLKKPPEDLDGKDLIQMTEWIRVSIALLTDDKAMVDKCVEDLERLASSR